MTGDTFLELTEILVFGFSGQIGAGSSSVRHRIIDAIRSFDYELVVVDVSEVILEKIFDKIMPKEILNCEKEHPNVKSDNAKRVYKLQRRGNILRKKFGNDIIASLAIKEIIYPNIVNRKDTGKTLRVAFFMDSLKHNAEVELLRDIFGDSFISVGIISTDLVRKKRLLNQRQWEEEEFEVLSNIDAKEGIEHGQCVVRAITKSDYFFSNDNPNKESLVTETQRLLQLIFSVGIETPRVDEFGMHLAMGAASRSGCLSRQVGSSILDQNGTLLSTGRNDVPKYGGGLYSCESNQDNRCWNMSGACFNDKEKKEIMNKLVDDLTDIIPCDDSQKQKIANCVAESRIKNLIEFSRAVHAEMNAIMTIARQGICGLRGATLYCTTFPCHNCAKHIIDAGIARVVYLEPYDKSLARELHSDTISNPLSEPERNKVPFQAYGGVSPRRYGQLFYEKQIYKKDGSKTTVSQRKTDGRLNNVENSKSCLIPSFAIDMDSLWARIRKYVDASSDIG